LVYGGQITTFNNSLYGANYSWDFGDATGTVTGFQPLHTYASNGVYTITLTVTNGCGSASATQTITISSVGTENEVELAGIRVYPNPNDGKFTLELPENLQEAQLELRDMKGALIWKSQGNSKSLSQEIDLRQQLTKGSYLLRVSQGEKSWTKKLSIE
jgi:PKD repeat protein